MREVETWIEAEMRRLDPEAYRVTPRLVRGLRRARRRARSSACSTPAAGAAASAVRPTRRSRAAPTPARPAGSATRAPTRELAARRPRASPIALTRARRRSIGFVVGADGLAVSAPRWVALRDIDAALREKGGWILRKLREQRERAQRLQRPRVDWRDGTGDPVPRRAGASSCSTRARPARSLDADADALPGVPRPARCTSACRTTPTPRRSATPCRAGCSAQARRVFEERCAHFAPRLGVRVTRLSLSSAQTRWGSASADGSIRLNWRLVHFRCR